MAYTFDKQDDSIVVLSASTVISATLTMMGV